MAEGDDIFSEDEWTGESQADESDDEPVEDSDEGSVEEDEDTAPTPEQETTSGDNGETPADAPTPEQAAEVKPNRVKTKIKVDREEREIEVDLDTELSTYVQKALNHDRMQAKLAEALPIVEQAKALSRAMGVETAEKMLSDAMENYREAEIKRLTADGTNEEMARDYVVRKMTNPVPDQNTEQTGAAPAADAAKTAAVTGKAPTRDFGAEAALLLQAHPELAGKPLPMAVLEACRVGKNLLVAYTEYEVQQAKAEAAKFRKENEIHKQNAASAAKAPVKGVSGGGATDTKAKDPFEEGFDSDDY